MAAGYLAGCVIGVFVAIKTEDSAAAALWTDSVDKTPDLFSALCGYGTYGAGMLLLSSSFLGFFLIPGVLAVRGFLSGIVFTACLRSKVPHALYRACAELLAPGLFLLPALLILGQICMRWSVRLYRCRRGETLAPDAVSPRELGAVFILLLLASVVKSYVVPYLSALI